MYTKFIVRRSGSTFNSKQTATIDKYQTELNDQYQLGLLLLAGTGAEGSFVEAYKNSFNVILFAIDDINAPANPLLLDDFLAANPQINFTKFVCNTLNYTTFDT